MVQKGKRKAKNDVEQLYDLDHEQTKSLNQVGEDQKLLDQYINEMTRTFASDYSITTFDALTALKLPSLPTILKEVYGEPVTKEEVEASLWTKIKEGTVEFGKGVVNTGKGAAIGVYDVGKDTLVGIGNTVMHPINTAKSMGNMILHPIDTGKYISNAIADSYERDMINGDAESRSHWVTYALGTAATRVFGTKGAGTVTKTGVATTKAGAKKAITVADNATKSVDLSRFLPYAPNYQLAGGARVPYNVVDGNFLKDQLVWQAESLKRVGKGLDNPTTRLPRTNRKWEGEPVNGKWYSDKPEVKNITNGEGVEFINGRPNFSPWSEGDIVFEKGKLTGTPNDFSLVYEQIQQQYNLPSKNSAKKLLKQAGVTPHHKSSTVIELIPTDLHGNIPHIGSASDLRGGY